MNLSQFIAGCFGIMGLVLSIIAGLYADNAFTSILSKGLLAAFICYIVGYLVGSVAQHVADEHAQLIADKVAKFDAEEAAKKQAEAEAKAAQESLDAVTAVPEGTPGTTIS